MSLIVILPLNRADTGPTRAAMTTAYALSPDRTNDSQPGRHAFRTSGSFSAAHTACGRAGTMRMLASSIASTRSGWHRCAARSRACERVREIGERFEVVHRQEVVDVRQERLDARRPRFESRVAQQRIQPDEPRARLGETLRLELEPLARVRVEPVADEQHDGVLREQ